MIEGEGLGGFARRLSVNDSAEGLFRRRWVFFHPNCAAKKPAVCSGRRALNFFEPRFAMLTGRRLTGRRLTGRSVDNNARRARPTNGSRQRLDSTLVEPALERSGNMSCLQNNRLEDCRASRPHSEARARCQCKQHADLSSHHSHLQILRAFYVFQRRANWYRRNIHAARWANHHWRSRFRVDGTGRHS